MADTLRKVDYFYAIVPDKPGEGARVMNGLRDAGVNLLAFSAFPSGRRSQLDLVPENSAALARAAKTMKLKLSRKKTGFLLVGDDRVGAMTGMLDKLGAAKINVTAVDAVATGDGRFGALFWVKPASVAKAAKLLGAK
jgi:hypothetical protein